MKALKEKRISLRSLWRRGLVILSLFALVFASCSDSSSGSGGSAADAGGPRVVKFTIKTQPTEDQFYGQPLDLTGLVLDVFYEDGSRDQNFTDTSLVTVFPKVATGLYYPDNSTDSKFNFAALNQYEVYVKGVHGSDNVDITGKMWFIYRSNTPQVINEYPGAYNKTKDGQEFGIVGNDDLGVHLTGYANIKQEAYADDDTYDLAGLTLEADYVKSMRKGTQVVRRAIKLRDTSWEIKPRYDRAAYNQRGGDENGGYYDGYLYITVGRFNDIEEIYGANLKDLYDHGVAFYDPEGNLYTYYDPDDGNNYLYTEYWRYNGFGITVLVPIEKVWTVKKGGIELVLNPSVEETIHNYVFWEENTRESWIKRFGSDAQLNITYTNGRQQTKDLKDIVDKTRIYWNSNTQEGAEPDWTEEGVYQGPLDFDIMTVRYPFTKKSADLGVQVYYRGAQTHVDVDVYTVLVRVNATQEVDFWPNPAWDNDIDDGPGGPEELAKRLEVTATYKAVNNEKVIEWPLAYYHDTSRWWYAHKTDSGLFNPAWWQSPNNIKDFSEFAGPHYYTGPYYLFATDWATADLGDDIDSSQDLQDAYADSTYAKGYKKYLDNLAKNKPTTTNVVVRHDIWVTNEGSEYSETTGAYQYGIVQWYNELFGARWNASRKYWQDPWPDFNGEGGQYNGILPNGYSPYNPDNTKAPWNMIGTYPNWYQDPSRNFGPKVQQGKKTKVKVNWVTHY